MKDKKAAKKLIKLAKEHPEWVAKGHKISSGVVKYYDADYNK